MTYNVIKSADEKDFIVQRIDENGNTSYIPNDPANSDYQAYLKSLENANQLQRIPGL